MASASGTGLSHWVDFNSTNPDLCSSISTRGRVVLLMILSAIASFGVVTTLDAGKGLMITCGVSNTRMRLL